jgi:hypothetical protein
LKTSVHRPDWVDREQERRRLRDAMRSRESLLIWGGTDSGKTALVARVMDDLPSKTKQSCLLVNGGASVKELLLKMTRALCENKHPLVTSQWRAVQGSHYTVSGWLRGQSGGRLRAMLIEALKERPCWIFLDHLPPCTHLVARFLQELMRRWETPVYMLAGGCSPVELGAAWSLYWNDKLRLHMGPLPIADASALLSACVRRFGLNRCELGGFEHEVLELSGRLPGTIVKMCEMAAQPQYQYQRQIKTRLVHVDYLMRGEANFCTTGRTRAR